MGKEATRTASARYYAMKHVVVGHVEGQTFSRFAPAKAMFDRLVEGAYNAAMLTDDNFAELAYQGARGHIMGTSIEIIDEFRSWWLGHMVEPEPSSVKYPRSRPAISGEVQSAVNFGFIGARPRETTLGMYSGKVMPSG